MRRPPGPALTVAVWDMDPAGEAVSWQRLLPSFGPEDFAQVERLWVSPRPPWSHRGGPVQVESGSGPTPTDTVWIPPYGDREADFLATALGHARGRWLLALRAEERLDVRNARTLLRYIRHIVAPPEHSPQEPGLFFIQTEGLTTAHPQFLVRLLRTEGMGSVSYVHRDLLRGWLETHPWSVVQPLPSVRLVPGPWQRTARQQTVPSTMGWQDWVREVSLGRRDLGATAGSDAEIPEALAPLPLPLWLDLVAESAFWRGDLRTAETAWEGVLQAEVHAYAPVAVRAELGLARIAEASGMPLEALARYAALACRVPGEPESVARLAALAFRIGEPWARHVAQLSLSLRSWQGIARALDRILPPQAQREGLAAVAPGPLRDLLLARAALRTGDPGLAQRTLLSSELALGSTEEARDVWTYARYVTELAGGRAEAARNLVLGWSGLSQAGRTALLVAERIVGQRMQVPDLPEEEDALVRQWLLLTADTFAEMGLRVQADQLRALAARASDFEDVSQVIGTRLATFA